MVCYVLCITNIRDLLILVCIGNLLGLQIFNFMTGSETRLTESLSLIDAVTPDIVAARQNAHNAQKQAIKAEPGSGGEQNGVDVCI